MKRILLLFFCLLAILPAHPLRAAETEAFIINMTSYYPDWHPVMRDVLRPWAKEVLFKSQGRLIINLFEPNTICQDDQASQAVRLGQVGIGHGYIGAEAARFPLSMVSSLYLGLDNAKSLTEAFWRMYAELPEISGEYTGIKILALHAASPYQICMFKKPVYSVKELAGKKMLVDSPGAARKMSLLGAEPLQNQLVAFVPRINGDLFDGAMLTLAQANTAGLQRQIEQVVLADVPGGICWLGMHQGLWDILPQDLRKVLTGTTGKNFSRALGESIYNAHKSEVEKLRQFRMNVHYFSAEERLAMQKTLQPQLFEEWQLEAKRAGVNAPRTLYEKISRIAVEASRVQ